MASTKPTARKDVDFSLLDDIEPGDVVQLRFKADAIDDVTYLLGIIHGGIVTSADTVVLAAVLTSGDWGGDSNRSVQFSPTGAFDRFWFEGRMARCIDQLKVVSRRRPLVDASVLEQPGASVRYRFKVGKDRDVAGVQDLLDLHEMGLLELGNADGLQYIASVEEWIFPKSRAGHFTNHLAGDDNVSYREHFIANVIPYLELLRP